MKLSFLDFWDGFIDDNNFIIHLIRSVSEVELVQPSVADVIIYSCFGQENRKYNCKKIFFTGENKRPNLSDCDYSISFDFDDYGGRNIRIPLWYYYIDWFEVGTYGNPQYLIPVDYLMYPNEFSKKEKNKFCCAVYSNPISMRNQFISIISQYKSVDCYGKLHGFNYLPDGEKNKMNVISNYKFNVCFENSVYPGYFTEKILHAKVSGSIPIYYSDKSFDKDFNVRSCINLIDYNNQFEVLDLIKEIDNNDSLYNQYRKEPLFNKTPNLDEIKNKISKII
jgi:hypothetical protein